MKPKQIAQLYGTEKEPNPQAGRVYDKDGISPCLDSCGGGNRQPKIAIPVLTPDRPNKRQNGRRFKTNGEPSFTLTAQDRHGVLVNMTDEKKGVPIRNGTKTGYQMAYPGDGIQLQFPESENRRGRVQSSSTLQTTPNQGVLEDKSEGWRIRKLTPKECFRLQGWTDDYFEKAKFVNSDSQLYKQAGNGVTVSVISNIAKAIWKNEN